MKIQLSSDLINTLGKVTGGFKVIVNLPNAEWETIRCVLDGTYRLIHATPSMVIVPWSDSLLLKAGQRFHAH